jgi:hypothetical protein
MNSAGPDCSHVIQVERNGALAVVSVLAIRRAPGKNTSVPQQGEAMHIPGCNRLDGSAFQPGGNAGLAESIVTPRNNPAAWPKQKTVKTPRTDLNDGGIPGLIDCDVVVEITPRNNAGAGFGTYGAAQDQQTGSTRNRQG